MTEELTVDVPLVAIGEAPAVTLSGGTLLHPTETVKVRALPDHLPQSIEYAVDSLVDFDATLRVRDLTIPDDVTLLTDGDEIIAKVQAPRVIEVEEVPSSPRAQRAKRARPPRARAPKAPGRGRVRARPTRTADLSRRAPRSGATRAAASADVITGITSKSTRSLHSAIHASTSRRSAPP